MCVCLSVCRVVVQPPPKSLEELLERQWEQTAQFILDQAGSKNNGKAGRERMSWNGELSLVFDGGLYDGGLTLKN